MIVVQNEVIDLLLDALNRKLIDLVSITRSLRLLNDWGWLRYLLLLRFEKSALEGEEGVEEATLGCESLLILEHLLGVVA